MSEVQTEEVVELEVDQPQEDQVTQEDTEQGTDIPDTPAQTSKYEESARSQGWVPLTEWHGDPDDWTDAKEFVRRGELMHKISSQSSEIKELRKAIGGLMEHHTKVKETEYKRAMEYLKQEKKAALESGDADKLLAVDDAIDTLKEEGKQAQQEKQEVKAAGPTQTFTSWVRNNPWYINDPELRAFADDVGVGYFNRNQGVAEEELYNLVKQRVMKAYPEKFKGQGSKSPQVEGTATNAPKRTDSFKLNEEEERVCKTFVRSGVMTREQYIADLKLVKSST